MSAWKPTDGNDYGTGIMTRAQLSDPQKGSR